MSIQNLKARTIPMQSDAFNRNVNAEMGAVKPAFMIFVVEARSGGAAF